MIISHKPMILCFIFTVLGSTLAVARPMGPSEGGCRWHQKKAAACHVPISEPGAGRICCRLPNAPKDDWPAGMILGNADLALPIRAGSMHKVATVSAGVVSLIPEGQYGVKAL
jgi:hypothetical protein